MWTYGDAIKFEKVNHIDKLSELSLITISGNTGHWHVTGQLLWGDLTTNTGLEFGRYRVCWCPSLQRYQAISSHGHYYKDVILPQFDVYQIVWTIFSMTIWHNWGWSMRFYDILRHFKCASMHFYGFGQLRRRTDFWNAAWQQTYFVAAPYG